ncbi:MAG: hypothetical protein ACI9LE_001000 [Paraglaciecola sp.]|jgi:hypothetical protein
MMKKIIFTASLVLLALNSAHVLAKVSEQEAAKLAAALTPVGAERAGNADGSIPEWTGGMTTPPAGYQGEGTTRIDPFADEKPLFTINASNYSQYADKLSDGQKALFAKYPETFNMPVYPTHRTAAAPKWVYDNTKKNALNAELKEGGNGVVNAFGGYPFPMPKNGHEAIWNHLLRWVGQGDYYDFRSDTVYPNGEKTKGGGIVWDTYPYFDSTKDVSSYNGNIMQLLVQYDTPVRRKGEVIMFHDAVNASETPRQAWQYIPGQRRVRRAPTIGMDTPNAQFAGQSVYDEVFMFNGSPERYDWKLVGKKEMYIPYNNNGLIAAFETKNGKADDIQTPHHLNPTYARYELHRVWVVESTLAEGKRHVYGKRTFYLDEDSWAAVVTDSYDGRGELWRVGLANMLNAYDVPVTRMRSFYHIDLQNDAYAVNLVDRIPMKIYKGEGDKFYTPAQVRKMSRR